MSTPAESGTRAAPPRRRGGTAFYAAGLLVALLLAGVLSSYASSEPDGLERVAEDHGFADQAAEHPLSGSPVADYEVRGVDDDRVSLGLGGIAGVLAVLVVAGALLLALRIRRSAVPPER
jgi:hypothetical protein